LTRPFSLFSGDLYDRALASVGLGDGEAPRILRRIAGLLALTWLPLLVLFLMRERGIGQPGRTSLIWDIAAWAQLVGFLPIATVAEVYIDDKIRGAVRHLATVAPHGPLAALADQAERVARSAYALAGCAVLGHAFTWFWARDELRNGLESWHTRCVARSAAGVCLGEVFTPAGWWVVLVSLPVFTFIWLRWTWKIGVWTLFLSRVSRLKLRLIPAHPDRTGGLGCLSDVQTSFALIIFGTSLLFAAFVWYKVQIEGAAASPTVWVPILGYVLLAPSAFMAPLFLFTRTLYRVKGAALHRYSMLGATLTRRFERNWLRADASRRGDLLDSTHASTLADFRTAYETVDSMRVVPFDVRSVAELFGSAAGPFIPLADLLGIWEKGKAIVEFIRPGAGLP